MPCIVLRTSRFFPARDDEPGALARKVGMKSDQRVAFADAPYPAA